MSKQPITDILEKIKALEAEAAALRAQAEEKRQEEMAEVVSSMKSKIAEYGLTAKDLGLDKKQRSARKGTRAAANLEGAVQYRGPAGELWTSKTRGRKPRWIAEALASGKQLADFEVK